MRKRCALPALGISILFFAWGCKTGSTSRSDNSEEEAAGPDAPNEVLRKYKPARTPTGTFIVDIRRIPLLRPSLIEIGDNGESIYQQGAGTNDFAYVTNDGKVHQVKRLPGSTSPHLLPNGKVVHSACSIGESRFNAYYPFFKDRSEPLLFDDGSYLSIDVKNVPGRQRSTYFLNREWHKYVPPGPDNSLRSTLVKSEEILQADNPIIFLEKTEKDIIWIQDHDGTDNRGKDKLIRVENGAKKEVAMPPGYRNVQRLAQTEDKVVATFGIIKGDLPYRSFRQTISGWEELPIPAGYDFSFVQKVFRDGSILGFVTTSDAQKMKNVLWKHEKLVELDDVNGWPKNGVMTICTLANRNGLISVNEISNRNTRAGSQYLLQLVTK